MNGFQFRTASKSWTGLAVWFLSPFTLWAVSLSDLCNDASLTPERFAHYFSEFKFVLHDQVQSPEVFLATQSGDCDDFATLAADVLREKGYTARLVVVFMPKDIHVVCFVEETKCYLDYNLRNRCHPIVASDGTLTDLANKVAESFQAQWHCVCEFTFKNGIRQVVYTDFPQIKPVAAHANVGPKASRPLVPAATPIRSVQGFTARKLLPGNSQPGPGVSSEQNH